LDLTFAIRSCRNRYVIVEVHGECDITSAPVLRERLLGVLARRSAWIVLDLSGLGFLDCAGAGALLAVSRRAMLLGGTLAIVAPAIAVARLLQLTDLDRHLLILSGVDAATAPEYRLRRPRLAYEGYLSGRYGAEHAAAAVDRRAAAVDRRAAAVDRRAAAEDRVVRS
jgi:anti-sigma B factor antagonist